MLIVGPLPVAELRHVSYQLRYRCWRLRRSQIGPTLSRISNTMAEIGFASSQKEEKVRELLGHRGAGKTIHAPPQKGRNSRGRSLATELEQQNAADGNYRRGLHEFFCFLASRKCVSDRRQARKFPERRLLPEATKKYSGMHVTAGHSLGFCPNFQSQKRLSRKSK